MPTSPFRFRRARVAVVAALAVAVLAAPVALGASSSRSSIEGTRAVATRGPTPLYRGPSPPSLEQQVSRAVVAAGQLDAFYAGIAAHIADEAAAEQARRAVPVQRDGTVGAAATAPAGGSGYPCGGDLPPCWVLDRESGYNDGDPFTYDIHAYNPSGCDGRGCYGKWQCDPRSCDGTGDEAAQDAEARRLWDGGRGCSHWGACRG